MDGQNSAEIITWEIQDTFRIHVATFFDEASIVQLNLKFYFWIEYIYIYMA